VHRAQARAEKSIAVLPFTDMSQKKDQEYLADGMAEEILNQLAEVPDLVVPARTSSFYFKGKQTKIPDIAAAGCRSSAKAASGARGSPARDD
jgi:TolB-like protein